MADSSSTKGQRRHQMFWEDQGMCASSALQTKIICYRAVNVVDKFVDAESDIEGWKSHLSPLTFAFQKAVSVCSCAQPQQLSINVVVQQGRASRRDDANTMRHVPPTSSSMVPYFWHVTLALTYTIPNLGSFPQPTFLLFENKRKTFQKTLWALWNTAIVASGDWTWC